MGGLLSLLTTGDQQEQPPRRSEYEILLADGVFFRAVPNPSHLTTSNAGTGAGFAYTGRTGGLGLLTATTGSTATGRAAVLSDNSAVDIETVGAGFAVEWVYESGPTLSNGTNTFLAILGFLNNATGTSQPNSFYLDISESNVLAVINNASANVVSQVIATQVAGNLYRARVDVKAGVARFWFKIETDISSDIRSWPWADADLKLTVSSGVPAGFGVGIGAGLFKSVGTTSRQLRLQRYVVSAF